MSKSNTIEKPTSRYCPVGFAEQYRSKSQLPKSFIIFGLSESGVKYVSELITKCGISLYDEFPALFVEVGTKKNIWTKFENIFNCANEKHDLWGWSDHRAHEYLTKLAPLLQNPSFIVVWDDALTIAREIDNRAERLDERLSKVSRESKLLVNVISGLVGPVLMVSGDKARQSPHALLEQVCEFLELNVPYDMYHRLETEVVFDKYLPPR